MRRPALQHRPDTVARTTDFYFKIEQHFCTGGEALTIKDIMQLWGLKSVTTAKEYINILEKWGLITHNPRKARTFVLAKTNYPPVAYRNLEGIRP